MGGTGLVTLDYGSGSPQEAAAELAYVDGSPADTTPIGSGIEWNDGTGQWQTVNWGTVGSWAALRGASPLAEDDGLNFLRIAHPATFTDIKYWEVGNEEYGSWEVDHHGTAAPGGVSTGAQHDPATYAAFARQFAALADEIQTTAGLPPISIGIDSGDPTGASDGNWTKNVLADGLADGLLPGFISDHSYMQGPGAESDSFLLDDTVSDSGSVLDWTTRYADYQNVLQQTLGSQAASVPVMATEYNSVYTNPGKQSTSLMNGLFVADSLGSLLDSGYSGGFVWDLRNSWDTGQNNSKGLYGWREGGDYGQLGDPNDNSPPATGPYVAYPGYYAVQLASKIIQNGGQVVSAASNYGDLDVYAVVEPSGDLDLLVINVNPAASLTEQFNVTGFQPGGPAQVWQYGEAQDTAQSQSATGASALSHSSTTLSLGGTSFSYAFPAYSMTVLDLQPFQSISVSPGSSSLDAGGSQQFAAIARDQFGNLLASQPAFTWSLIGGGSLTAGGLYTPPYAFGTATVEAASGPTSGTAAVTFSGQAQWFSNTAAAWTTSGDWKDTVSGSAVAAPGLRGIVGDTILLGPSALGAVDLNGASPSLGAVTFSGASGSTIAQGTGGSLLMNDGGSPAAITVANGSHAISAPTGPGRQRPLASRRRQPIDHLRRGQRRGPVALGRRSRDRAAQRRRQLQRRHHGGHGQAHRDQRGGARRQHEPDDRRGRDLHLRSVLAGGPIRGRGGQDPRDRRCGRFGPASQEGRGDSLLGCPVCGIPESSWLGSDSVQLRPPLVLQGVAQVVLTPARNVLTGGWALARRGPNTAASQTD